MSRPSRDHGRGRCEVRLRVIYSNPIHGTIRFNRTYEGISGVSSWHVQDKEPSSKLFFIEKSMHFRPRKGMDIGTPT